MTHPWKSTDENNVIMDIRSLVISLSAVIVAGGEKKGFVIAIMTRITIAIAAIMPKINCFFFSRIPA